MFENRPAFRLLRNHQTISDGGQGSDFLFVLVISCFAGGDVTLFSDTTGLP
jgi:hypothetical protein